MLEKTMQKYERAARLVADGARIKDAIRKEHMSMATWYKCKAATRKPRKYNKTKPAKFIDLAPVTAPNANNVAVVVCSLDQVKNVIEVLR